MVPTMVGENVRIVFPGAIPNGVNTLYLSVEEEGGVPYLRPIFRDLVYKLYLVSFTTFHKCIIMSIAMHVSSTPTFYE